MWGLAVVNKGALIKRDSGWTDKRRNYKVVLDDTVIANIADGQSVELDVPPGKHRLMMKIDWCTSNTIELEINDENIEFKCGSSMSGAKLLIPSIELVNTTFRRKQYIWLKQS